MRFKKEYSFDERKDAELIIENGFSDGKINYVEMQKVAKYFRNVSGFGAVKLEREIISFCQKQDPDFNPVVERNSIKSWVKAAMTNTLRKIDEIPVTEYEVKITSEKHYIQYNKFGDVIRLSKIRMSEIQLCDIYYEFGQMGLITPYNPEKEIISINFVDKLSPVVFTFADQERFLEYFNQYFNGRIINCIVCGKEILQKAGNHERCKECSSEVRKQQKAEWKRTKYNKTKKVDIAM